MQNFQHDECLCLKLSPTLLSGLASVREVAEALLCYHNEVTIMAIIHTRDP